MRRLINERVLTSNNLPKNELKGTLADHERSLVSIKLPNSFYDAFKSRICSLLTVEEKMSYCNYRYIKTALLNFDIDRAFQMNTGRETLVKEVALSGRNKFSDNTPASRDM